MSYAVQVTDKVHLITANDRRTHLFENMWPLPNGVSYNSYLINDEKVALLDTMEHGSADDFLDHIEEILQGKPVDYLIVNHMEPDHSGAMREVVKRYPEVKIIGNIKTFKIIRAYFGYEDNLMEVTDGDELNLGSLNLKFVMTPWVHWPETMMTIETTKGILFSGDAFGSFGTLDGGVFDDEIEFDDYYEEEMRRYFSNIVGKYSNMVQKAFKKLDGVRPGFVCPLHGPVWRENPGKVLELYDKWSSYKTEDGVVIIFGSMYGNTERMADHIARKLSEQGIKKIRVYDASKTHLSYLINEVWRYKGVILGSCAYNSSMLPTMEHFTRTMEHMSVKDHYLGLFGSYSWNGGGVKTLMKFAEKIDWELVDDPIEIKGIPTEEKLPACDKLAKAMAEKIKE